MIRSISLATITLITLVVLATGIVSAAPRQQVAVNICSRTAQAQTAILDKVSGDTCSDITDTQLAAITELIVTGYSNASLVPGDFAGLTGLTELSINNSPTLTTIPADAFSEVTGLTRLNLFGNRIATLDTNTFAELQNLTDLNLSANAITELDQDIFDGLTSLTSLGLSDNAITELDQDTFDGLTSLTSLGLSGNAITELDQDTFDGLDNLQELNLASNMLSILDEDIFDGLTELTLLEFGSNEITTMHTDTFEDITKLKTLDFRNNPITNLDEDIFDGLINLQTLNFENLDITTLDGNIFDGLTSLKSLEFIGNRITTLEQGIFQPITALTNLDLTGNSITSLDGNIFSNLANLTTLKLPNNKITTLHQDTFDGLDNLVELNLANNRIATLPVGSFADLTSLQNLNLVCNFLKEINLDRFDPFATTLTTLNIRYNNFATEPNPTDIHARLTNLGNLVHGPRDEGARCGTPTVKVGIAASAYTVTEGNTQTITFTLDRDPERQVTIPLIATKQGGASSDDYSGVPASLTFNSSETQKSFDFTATQDDEDDDGESVKLGFGTLPAGVNPATTNETTVRINDDDDPEITVSFGASAHTIPEDGMQEVTITLSAEPERSVTILITVEHQGGASSNDYSGVPDSMTFTSSETQKSFTFNATQDTEDDDDESVRLAFGTLPSRVSAGTVSETTVTITDDDDPAVAVNFGSAAHSVTEGGTVEVTVTLDVDPERTVTVPLTVTDQDGASPADYSGVPASVTFDSGEVLKTFTFSATQDDVDDDGESVKLTFGTPLPARVSAGTTSGVTIRITDDDDPEIEVSFSQTTYTVAEGLSVTATVTLNANPERTVTVPLTAVNQGGATSADYSGVPASLTFNSGETSRTFDINTVDDTIDDDDEKIILSFGTLPPRVTEGTNRQTTININDDDVPTVTVSFGAGTYTVPEGQSQPVTIILSADPERTVTVPLRITHQDGASTADYSEVPTEITFNAGDTSKSFNFSATDDTIDDDDESVKLEFGSLPHRVSAGDPDQTIVNITDNDDPQVTVSFDRRDQTLAEGGTQPVTIILSADPERSVTIPIMVTHQGGASLADYTGLPASMTLTFNAGDTSKSFDFSATQDDVDDDGERVLLSLGTLPAGVIPGNPDTATLRITDDDDPQVTTSFETGTHTVAEGDTATITVTLSADPERTLVIPLNRAEQGGATSADYSGVPATVSFAPGQVEAVFTFRATQDEIDDDNEKVRISFGAMPDSRITTGATDQTTVSITDDDVPEITVSFGAGTYTVPEGQGLPITIILSADPERTVVIPLTAMEQDGASSADYSGLPSSLTFNTGQTQKSFTFTAAQDTVDDDDESVKLAFSTNLPSRVSTGTPHQTTVRITDDDDPQVTVMFAQASYLVVEGETVTVRVALSADPERTVTIPLVTANQDGASSADYSVVPLTITINASESSKTFEFMATEDDTPDAGESVKFTFGASLPPRVTPGTPNEATVTINEVYGQFGLDCSESAAVWCADLELSDRVSENYGWLYMRYGQGWDPPAHLSPDNFTFRGAHHTVRSMELRPGTHPVLPNAWSRWQQGYSSFGINIQSRGGLPRANYQDWILHLDGLELPFKDALRSGSSFVWVGPEIQQIFNDWTPHKVNRIGIEEVAVANQNTNPMLPWTPMQVDAVSEGPDRLRIIWAKPNWYHRGLPAPTKYIVQWKLASASWSDSTAISQREVAATSNFESLAVKGLNEDTFYSVRVIASNDSGDGPPSPETLGRPQDHTPKLIARTVNGDTLTLRFSNRLDTTSVPAETAFTVIADGGLIMVDSLAIKGNEVILTLNRPVTAATHSVKVRYDRPADTRTAFLRDTNSNHVHIRQHHELLQAVNVTPQSSVQPLTAEFTNHPASHDGSTRFAFEIKFSEPVWISDGLARDDMLRVTGGTVISAHWKDRRTDIFRVEIQPRTNGDIIITLPGNQHCNGIIAASSWTWNTPIPGTPCAIGNRSLTREVTETIPGPSSPSRQQQALEENIPAEGRLWMNGLPELGQTLSADTSEITDANELHDTVFRYQWMADGADILGANGPRYTLVQGDLGSEISLRVNFTDDAGYQESITSAAKTIRTTGLQLQSATVDGVTLTLTYNEVLHTDVPLSRTAFSVSVNGASRSLSDTAASETNVMLSLSETVAAGDTVTVDYIVPEGQDFIRDIRGRKAASFSQQTVNNHTATDQERTDQEKTDQQNTDQKKTDQENTPPDSLQATIHDQPSSHNGQDPFTFELRLSESPKESFSYKTVRDHAFTVTGGRVNQARRLEPGKNVRWEITVAPGSGADVTLSLRSTTDCSTQGAICTEDGRKLSGKLQLDVPGPNTPAAGAPTIKVTAQVGETLTASTSGISDADGLTNTTFTYQWLSEYTEISDATGKSYTVTDDDVGQPIRVRVSFTDDAGNAETLTSTATATVVRPPLTASAQNVPQSHDGQNTFTFEMEFSQEPDLSYTTIRDHAFTVTGGSVTYVRRLEPGRNIGWKIHVTPNGNGDVTLSLRSTTDCSAQGAICTKNGRKLSGGPLTSIPGPNTSG